MKYMRICSGTIWNEFNQSLKKFIRSKISDTNDIDDILQDIFIKFHQSIDQLNNELKVKAWIFKITRNIVNDYYRKKYNSIELVEFDDDSFIDTDN